MNWICTKHMLICICIWCQTDSSFRKTFEKFSYTFILALNIYTLRCSSLGTHILEVFKQANIFFASTQSIIIPINAAKKAETVPIFRLRRRGPSAAWSVPVKSLPIFRSVSWGSEFHSFFVSSFLALQSINSVFFLLMLTEIPLRIYFVHRNKMPVMLGRKIRSTAVSLMISFSFLMSAGETLSTGIRLSLLFESFIWSFYYVSCFLRLLAFAFRTLSFAFSFSRISIYPIIWCCLIN